MFINFRYAEMIKRGVSNKSLMMLKYEDIVSDPALAARSVYSGLLNTPVPPQVIEWMNQSVDGQADTGLIVSPSLESGSSWLRRSMPS